MKKFTLFLLLLFIFCETSIAKTVKIEPISNSVVTNKITNESNSNGSIDVLSYDISNNCSLSFNKNNGSNADKVNINP